MYDGDGNGVIETEEITKIVNSLYAMMGPKHAVIDQYKTPQERAESIFKRMDINADGRVEMKEFVRCCLDDQKLIGLLTHLSP